MHTADADATVELSRVGVGGANTSQLAAHESRRLPTGAFTVHTADAIQLDKLRCVGVCAMYIGLKEVW